MSEKYDAVIVGGGPNGLAAAITLADRGFATLVIEANEQLGGGASTMELTLPGFHHDICSAIHPMAAVSPFFKSLSLERFGLEWVAPTHPLAHPFDDGTALVLEQDISETTRRLGRDATRYQSLLTPFVDRSSEFFEGILAPPIHIPGNPVLLARFGLVGALPATWAANLLFREEKTRAFFAGFAAHSIVSLEKSFTTSIGVALMVAGHVVGWPFPRGGARSLTAALERYLISRGGKVITGQRVRSLEELPDARVVLFDVTPRQLLEVAGDSLSPTYKARLSQYVYGPGIFKMDWALSSPIPWKAEECRHAGTVHVGGTFPEVCKSELAAWEGKSTNRPFVLVAQQSLFDSSRAPGTCHTGWAYCHVPHNSSIDMIEAIEQQIERFAPGFRDTILARNSISASSLSGHNSNLIGGDITGGANHFPQLLFRPFWKLSPYRTSSERLFLCSSSTPPGGGVHGMCGYFAAKEALKVLER